MTTNINWGLLNTEPVGANAFAHFQAGKEDRRKTDVRNAFAQYGSDPEGASQALMQAGEYEAGMKLQDRTAAKAAQARRERAFQTAAKGNFKDARAQGGADLDLQATFDKMEAADLKAADDRVSKIGAVVWNMRHNIPQDQWAAHLQQVAPFLTASGVSPEDISKIDLTPQGLDGYIALGMTMKDQIANSVETRKLDQGDARIAESGRHNRAVEGISAGQLGVARSNSARGWAAHNARQKAGGYGAPGSTYTPDAINWDN